MFKNKRAKIGTRGSSLALWQANWVKEEIIKRHPGIDIDLVKIKTSGDKITDVPLARVGGKGLFVKEIEEALLRGEIDLAVHSMKDVPTELPEGLHIAAITRREDPRDAVIINQKLKIKNQKLIKELPQGAVIGTSSLRRSSQLLNVRPDLKIVQLRGNLDTRLKKLDEGQFDAIILAAAGVKRLGLGRRIAGILSPDISLPAIGQGALGIEMRKDDAELNDIISFLNHDASSVAVRAERAFLRRLQGGCQVPIAAYGEIKGSSLRLTGLVGSIDGSKIVKDSISGYIEECEDLGKRLAERLLSKGAKEILDEVYKGGLKGGSIT